MIVSKKPHNLCVIKLQIEIATFFPRTPFLFERVTGIQTIASYMAIWQTKKKKKKENGN